MTGFQAKTFYPDFLCQLPGKDQMPGPILAVEYKGADRCLSAEDDRLIGGCGPIFRMGVAGS